MRKWNQWAPLFLVWLAGCGGESMSTRLAATDPTTGTGTEAQITYKTHILPIFQKNCSMCHNATSAIPNWLDYNVAYAKRDRINQRAVVEKSMPLGRAMAQEERDLIGAWIKAGAPYDVTSAPPASGSDPTPSASTSATPVPTSTTVITPPPAGTPITYTGQILPLFQEKCSTCHNSTSSVPNWLDYNTAYLNRAKIRNRVFVVRDMPMVGSLTDAQRQMVADWVDAGAPYDASTPPGTAPSPTVTPSPTPAPTPTPTSTSVTPPPPGSPISYTDQILPLFQDKCSMCHNADSALPNWLDYNTAFTNRAKIRNRVFVVRDMPKVGTLTDAQRQMVADWVDAGAPYSATAPAPSTTPSPTPTTPTTPKPMTYDDLLKPRIFATVCVSCHNAQTKAPNWQDYTTVCDEIDKIYEQVVVKKTMPKDMPFPDSERKLMADWINAGAPKSTTSGACRRLR